MIFLNNLKSEVFQTSIAKVVPEDMARIRQKDFSYQAKKFLDQRLCRFFLYHT